MMSRQHRDVATKVDVATRDGGRDKRSALKLWQVWKDEADVTQAVVATRD